MNILIIEDETKTAKALKAMIERLGDDLHVTGIVPSVKAAIQWLGNQSTPELILSDIQLSDGLSFEIFRTVQPPCPVIFCTAYDQYAIQAFEANGIDYLLKPIDEDKLARGLRKYEQMRQLMGGRVQTIPPGLETLLKQLVHPAYKSSLLVFKNEKIIPISTKDIAFVYSVGGIVHAYTQRGETYLIQEVLDELESILDPSLFFRANRQFIINRAAVQMAEHFFNRRLIVKLSVETPERIIVSKVKASDLLAWLAS
ncbi:MULTISPECIES: LytR/AlgR family response regulator transcription factor [Sphingobacteriaceae]|uniref:Two component transcriptional regulator, LytTR family n=1 Tax=Sphingobacterium sp. (strain 21) TaxID=743722 RepID=F4CBJ9_SPHS2